jgi:hypothetical protein
MHAAHPAAGLAIKGHASKAPGPGVDDRGLHARIKVDHLIILGVVGIEPSPGPAFCADWALAGCSAIVDNPVRTRHLANGMAEYFPSRAGGGFAVSARSTDLPIIPRAWRSIDPSFYRSIVPSLYPHSSFHLGSYCGATDPESTDIWNWEVVVPLVMIDARGARIVRLPNDLIAAICVPPFFWRICTS